ncbi:type VII secretion protein EsaA [Staphylococcus caprae]|uniref:type VII secretion protein EsaA n=1 Tax=Staphylococcus caprae TaxID=29380 RepID=UPI001C833266|nr:type VII secretion protein EsaA [Staphylococcus caprae]MBX5322297.1 type VII secretion protein EsaA [Staphylococcus caprae]
MKKKNWIYSLIIILIIVLAIVGLITFVHTKYGNQAENHTKNETKDYKNIHIAIINEDQPTKYNGKKIELGEPFIKRLSEHSNYNFETVSRNIAENGLKDGKYQVMIVIPKNFSKLAMQLDEKTPSKMSIQYKTAVGQKEDVAKKTEKVVSDVLNDFNKNLINIYLTSIIDNLHNAQENVGDIMKRERNVDQIFANYLLNPLNDFPELFTDTLVNSLVANKDITSWIQNYNHSLLSANSNIFNIDNDYNASSIVQDQGSFFDKNISALEQTLDDYKTQKDNINVGDYISELKQMNKQIDQQSEEQDRSKEEYNQTFKENLEKVKDDVKEQESPFTKDMIEDYRQKLTESLEEQLRNNQDLNDALDQIKQDNQNIQDTMMNHLKNTIENDHTGFDNYYIRKLTNEDLENAGLSWKATREYQHILDDMNQFISKYNEANPDHPIKQDDYHGEINADDTSKLTNEGVKFERKETIKSKDINRLSIATDPNFDFDGTVYINDKKYDVKDQDIKLDTTQKSYDVEVKGTAKLKGDHKNQEDFLKDKTMHLQLVFGQADKDDENKKANVVDLSINHNLEGKLVSGDLDQQLRSLDQFKSEYDLYKDSDLDPKKPKIDNKAIVNMMVDQVIKDMESFKDDKSALLKEIDSLSNSSNDMIDKIFDNKQSVENNKKELNSIIDSLNDVEKQLEEDPETPKIEKDKGKEFTTLSTHLDDQVNKLSERSTKLLSDSQNSKSTADSISGELNKLDDNVNNLHASGRALGTRANDLNKQMANNDKDNQLFAKDFANVLKNSKDGDRQNKALKDFMSNPIQKQNLENVLANNGDKDTFSPTLLVLLMYLISMMTAYVFYSYERAKGQINFIKDDFSKNNHIWNRVISSAIVTFTGMVEGLAIGLIAMNRYQVMPGYKVKFIFMILVTMIVFVLINTYLLRQLKSIGMFIMIVILAVYFIAMNYLNPSGSGSTLNRLSPLSYVDSMIYNYLNAEHPVGLALLVLSLLAIVGFVLNMFIKHFKKERLI